MTLNQKIKPGCNVALHGVGVSDQVLIAQCEKTLEVCVLSRCVVTLSPDAVVAEVLVRVFAVFAGHYRSRVATQSCTSFIWGAREDVSDLLDIVRLLADVELALSDICWREDTDLVVTVTSAVETGGHQHWLL